MALSTEIQRKAFQHPGSFALYSIVLCLAFLVLRAIYNIYFHPLSSFPGPKSAVASNVPYVVAQVRGKLPHWLSTLHEAYASPIVRISPNELSFIDGEAWKDIYSHSSGHTPFEKDLLIYGEPPNGVHSLLTAPKEDHARMRRVIDHAFSDKASRDQEPIVTGHIDNLIQRLHVQTSGPNQGQVDVVEWFNWMSFDIIGDLSFGQSFACLETQTYHPWVDTIFGNLKGITFMGACNRFTILRYILPFLIPKRVKQMMNDHWAATTANVDRRLKLGTNRPDFMSPILRHNNDEKASLRHEELMSNASLFVIAGSEAVATNLVGTTYYLLQNPNIMRKIREEVDSAFTSEDQITPQSVADLPYLQACLSETNRIYPAALTGQAMRVPPAGDAICGIWVPGGTGVTINQYAAYRSPTNFTDPNKYVPERWLSDPRYVSDDRNIFQPFSFGPRSCIGKGLANLETRLALARMIWNFTIEMSDETSPDWEDQQVYLSWQKKPLIVKLKARERPQTTKCSTTTPFNVLSDNDPGNSCGARSEYQCPA